MHNGVGGPNAADQAFKNELDDTNIVIYTLIAVASMYIIFMIVKSLHRRKAGDRELSQPLKSSESSSVSQEYTYDYDVSSGYI